MSGVEPKNYPRAPHPIIAPEAEAKRAQGAAIATDTQLFGSLPVLPQACGLEFGFRDKGLGCRV